ncbi:glycosyltransferase family 1 protein [Phytohabitans rumicis]|uniref:Glycosyl transferase n=1 Tax=Phytohabitans rumicis TaxID=1076125 RepID=A0A6V8LBH6_9ACTN|nr:glycosyltransferase family 1 protein [Phytohabitans rumicis]GFJ90015.1 hypothetical protein Prum_036570 [Phytohabitans rumicis]
MTAVLLIAATPPQPAVLSASVRQLRATGARVHLVAALDADDLPDGLDLDGFHAMPADVSEATPRRRAVKATPGERVWMHLRRQAWLRERARDADVLVALDAHSVYTVWRLAQRNQGADARFGVTAALQAIAERGDKRAAGHVLPPAHLVAGDVKKLIRSTPRRVINTVTAKPVMRSGAGARLWLSALKAPKVPDPVRVKVAYQIADGMAWAGRPADEAKALYAAASKIKSLAPRARLRGEAAKRELAAGLAPAELTPAVVDLLGLADRYYRARDHWNAAEYVHRAMNVAFNRVLHIDQLTSPLAADPDGFVAPFRRSEAARKVAAPLGRKTPAAPRPTGRPLRLLIATSANDNFLPLIREHYEQHPDVEVRYLDLAVNPSLKSLTWASKPMLEYRLADDTTHGRKTEQRLRPHLDWADTVFVDWCVAPAGLFTLVDPGDARIIVRLHSYEALTRWPHMVDFSRIDDLVFVANHIRDLTTSLVPYLRDGNGPRMHVLDNAMDLKGFLVEKEPEARFQLGMVGINQVAKDPRWAVEVLRRLRAQDERYRLLLVGGEMDPDVSVATKDYLTAFRGDLAELEPSGAVRRFGSTNDVPKALAQIGVILSTSVREGCHCGLMEGAASAAVPVVRDWPFFAGRPNSARTLYPQDWVVGSPEEAAQRVLDTTGTEEAWHETGRRASAHALSAWDWSAVRHDFDRLILGDA